MKPTGLLRAPIGKEAPHTVKKIFRFPRFIPLPEPEVRREDIAPERVEKDPLLILRGKGRGELVFPDPAVVDIRFEERLAVPAAIAKPHGGPPHADQCPLNPPDRGRRKPVRPF